MHRLQLKSAHSCSAPKPYGVCVFMLCEVTVTTLHGTSQSVPQSVSVGWGGVASQSVHNAKRHNCIGNSIILVYCHGHVGSKVSHLRGKISNWNSPP